MPRFVSYRFGRLNITTQETDKGAFLFRSLTSKVDLFRGRHSFGFFDIERQDIDRQNFLSGKLAKFRPEAKTEVADLMTHKLEDQTLSNYIVAKAPFVLHIKSGLIAYRLTSGQIDNDNFRRNFGELIEKANNYFFVQASILAVKEDLEILTAMRRLKSIISIDVTVHPTNPSFRPIYKPTDERLKKMEAATLKERYKAKDENRGLQIPKGDEIEGRIQMAEDGYGDAKVVGLSSHGDKRVTIRSRDNPVTAQVEATDESMPSIISKLAGTFERLIDRVKDKS